MDIKQRAFNRWWDSLYLGPKASGITITTTCSFFCLVTQRERLTSTRKYGKQFVHFNTHQSFSADGNTDVSQLSSTCTFILNLSHTGGFHSGFEKFPKQPPLVPSSNGPGRDRTLNEALLRKVYLRPLSHSLFRAIWARCKHKLRDFPPYFFQPALFYLHQRAQECRSAHFGRRLAKERLSVLA